MKYKRYQYWSSTGIQWTDWFVYNSDYKEPIQMKGFKGNNLKNEYKNAK